MINLPAHGQFLSVCVMTKTRVATLPAHALLQLVLPLTPAGELTGILQHRKDEQANAPKHSHHRSQPNNGNAPLVKNDPGG